ncbi:hypothetical protein TWF694_000119 [Orbilia ellipsospora]|uniref:Uncharacterized protein n=1 Tax=Orbilia ellipsospora TaxID=2528407 RepID=A0AAV9XP26_9PEZI
MSSNDYSKSKENVRRPISPEPFKPFSYLPERRHPVKEAWEIRPKSTPNSPHKAKQESSQPQQPSLPLASPSKNRRKKEKPKYPGPEADGKGAEERPTAGGMPWYEETFYDIAYGRHPGNNDWMKKYQNNK